jgi:glycosyltransferase involved in cell wall biosynthesis
MGKPVIATTTHTMEQFFKEDCYLADNKESFVLQLDKSIEEAENPQKIESRLTLAKSHSWENVAKKILKIINQHL